MNTSTKQIEVTHTVPVDTLDTLRVYLANQNIETGDEALDLILGAGFTVRMVKTRKKNTQVAK